MTGRSIVYQQGEDKFEGWLVSPSSSQVSRPAVLLIHNWMGVAEEAKKQAARIAELGYTVFAADIYGQGVRPKNQQEAAKLAGIYKTNRQLFRQRLNFALTWLKSQPNVDPTKIVAVGYCFGGTGVLELARSGAEINGVVSFHGGLDSPNPADGAKIRTRVLALHGADDPFVKPEDLNAFESEMRQHHVDWQLIKYGNAVHSFTDMSAGNDPSKGAAYHAEADRRSFIAFVDFAKSLINK